MTSAEIREKRFTLEAQIHESREATERLEREHRALKDSCTHDNVTEHFDGNKDWEECLDCGRQGRDLLKPGQEPVRI